MTPTNGTNESSLVPVGRSFALVNPEDVRRVSGHVWAVHRVHRSTYARDRQGLYMHHLIIGKPLPGMEVDHINGNGLDNRLCNLRICSPGQNQFNRAKPGGWLGVQKRGSRYRARLKLGGKTRWLGTFDTQEEAALARDAGLDRLAGPFGARNFPVLISADEAVRLLSSCKGHFFRVLFRRRAATTVRSMLCRCGVRLGTTGLGLAFEPRDRGLLPVWDARLKAHRFVNLLGVLAGIVDKTRFRVGPRARSLGATMERPEGLVHGR